MEDSGEKEPLHDLKTQILSLKKRGKEVFIYPCDRPESHNSIGEHKTKTNPFNDCSLGRQRSVNSPQQAVQ